MLTNFTLQCCCLLTRLSSLMSPHSSYLSSHRESWAQNGQWRVDKYLTCSLPFTGFLTIMYFCLLVLMMIQIICNMPPPPPTLLRILRRFHQYLYWWILVRQFWIAISFPIHSWILKYSLSWFSNKDVYFPFVCFDLVAYSWKEGRLRIDFNRTRLF